ncbi:hypothetical protein ABFU82_20335 [Nocardioides sp. WV_118_6]
MRPNTPGPGGYALAWLVSVLLVDAAVVLGTDLGGPPAGLADAVIALWAVGVSGAFFSLPIAIPGVLMVHLACRAVPAQWVHVAAAGLVGLAPAVMLIVATGEPPELGLALLAGSTALGRLVVVPLVWRRRDSARSVARC